MKTLLLLSGGIDSPVAAHLLQKQGVELGALHFSMEPITDDSGEVKSRILAKKLGIKDFYVVNSFGKTLEHISNACEHKYYFVLMRRIMYRVATELAKKVGYDNLATGENLAQVGSQTLDNLTVIDRATDLIVLRPLLSYDKVETIKIAEAIDTFETSKGPELCAVLGPKHPITRAKLDKVLEEEKKIEVKKIVEELVNHISQL